MPKQPKPISVFRYMDYRLFLKDWYTHARATGSVSLRSFSKKAGFTSPNYLKMVMDGDRNLSEGSLEKFLLALDLGKKESDFFRNLVFFNQAKSPEEKNYYYKVLLQSRKFGELEPIAKEQYEYYSAWYHPVIRELLVSKAEFADFGELGARLTPPISTSEAKRSVALLEKLGLVRKTAAGRWEQSEPVVTTGPEARSVTLYNYHQNVLDLAKRHLEFVPAEERDVSALTLGITPELLPEIKKRVQEFRRSILDLVAPVANPERVVLLTMQLLPVAGTGEDGHA